MKPVGHGMPEWLNVAEFLSADETRLLPERVYGFQTCNAPEFEKTGRPCGIRLERAHVARKQMGGRKHGGGPMLWLCDVHHDVVDDSRSRTLAVRRSDGRICWLNHLYDVNATVTNEVSCAVVSSSDLKRAQADASAEENPAPHGQ